MELLRPLAIEHAVLRPGTALRWRAFTKRTSKPRPSRIWNSGIQYRPVDSGAAVSIPHRSANPPGAADRP